MTEEYERPENARKIRCFYDKDDVLPPIFAKIKKRGEESISAFIVAAILEKVRRDKTMGE